MVNLEPTSLGPVRGFNWIELVSLLICGILSIFFLFYFNRLFATVVSYGIRAWTWHKYRAYVDITSLQISLLGGRLFFKGIRYHAHNMTIFVHDGQVTWRYWLASVQQAEIFQNSSTNRTDPNHEPSDESVASDCEKDQESGGRPRSRSIGKEEAASNDEGRKLPCRIAMKISGVEAFIYNRSPVYDGILEAAKRKKTFAETDNEASDSSDTAESPKLPKDTSKEAGTRAQSSDNDSVRSSKHSFEYVPPVVPSWLRMLPIAVDCRHAAAALGNQHTTSIVVAKIDGASGTLDAGKANTLDLFKLLVNFDLRNVQVNMKPNRDYKQTQSAYAEQVLTKQDAISSQKRPRLWQRMFCRMRWLLSSIKWTRLTRSSSSSVIMSTPGRNHKTFAQHNEPMPNTKWHGLARYLYDEDHTPTNEWVDVEYAKSSTLIDCPSIGFKFYWEIPGQVPPVSDKDEDPENTTWTADINGAEPPAYGMDFSINGGSIVYGPWADRQRINLQKVFLPASCIDSVPTAKLKLGEWRVSTKFKIYIVLEDKTKLRIPTRESSKDAQWSSNTQKAAGGGNSMRGTSSEGARQKFEKSTDVKLNGPIPDIRPFGWIDIVVEKNTTVNYEMDMFAGNDGFKNTLSVDVVSTEMTSSVNHGLLWRTGRMTVSADVSNPLGWNALRKWPFKIVCENLDLFIIRDHMFLITDLVNDWSTGPPPAFYTFVPFVYDMELIFRNFTLYLNTNDANIISNPGELDYNDFLALHGADLHGMLGISLQHFRPKYSGVSFEVLAQDLSMQLLSPARSTLRDLVKEKEIAQLKRFTMGGSYNARTETAPGMTDLLSMDLCGTGFDLMAHGFVVRHLINLKENYFGDYLHFKTLEEFQHVNEQHPLDDATAVDEASFNNANELDVILSIIVDGATVKFPTNIYSATRYVAAEVTSVNLDLRIVSYYLDMGLSVSPVTLIAESDRAKQSSSTSSVESTNTQVWIGGVELNGHRAFGLPPAEPAYACTWDIDIADVRGECSKGFLQGLVLASQAFIFTFEDLENAMPLAARGPAYDVNFVRVRTGQVRLWLRVVDYAFLVDIQPLRIDTNDLYGNRFSQRISVLLDMLTVACIKTADISREHATLDKYQRVHAMAFVQTGATIDVLGRKSDFEHNFNEQQKFLRRHDVRTHRTVFLQTSDPSYEDYQVDLAAVHPAAMPQPALPPPIGPGFSHENATTSFKSASHGLSPSITPSPRSSLELGSPIARAVQDEFGSRNPVNENKGSNTIHTTEEHSIEEGLAQPSVNATIDHMTAFSSPFMLPYFPLQRVRVCDRHVPLFPSTRASSMNGEADEEVDDMFEGHFHGSEETESTNILLEVSPGIRAYIELDVLPAILELVAILSLENSEDVIDDYQIRTMRLVADAKPRETSAQKNSLSVHGNLPWAAIRVIPSAKDDSSRHHVNFSIRSLQQMVRVKLQPFDGLVRKDLALRTTIEYMGLNVSRLHDAERELSLLNVQFTEILLWVGLLSKKMIHMSLRESLIDITGDHLSSLTKPVMHNSLVLQDAISQIEQRTSQFRQRLLLVIQKLTIHKEDVGDPPFISRMVFILRAFPTHFRNQESWKVLARFRYIYSQLDAVDLHSLVSALRDECIEVFDEAAMRDLYSQAQWRNWDIPNVGETVALKTLSASSDLETKSTDQEPVLVTLTLERMRIALEAAKRTNYLELTGVYLGIDSKPPTTPTGLLLSEENTRTFTTAQLHAERFMFEVNWSIFALAETLAGIDFRNARNTDHIEAMIERQKANTSRLDRHDFHVVIGVDDGNVKISSINLQFAAQAQNVQTSLIGTNQLDERYGLCVSSLINASLATTVLHCSEKRIWHTGLQSPSVYIDHRSPAARSEFPPTVTLSSSYEALELVLNEQPLGLLHIIDTVICDEVTDVIGLVKEIQDKPLSDVERDLTIETSVIARETQFNIAVLSRRTAVEVQLLQKLSYRLESDEASFRMTPIPQNHGADRAFEFDLDFDVKHQKHYFMNSSVQVQHRQGLLQIPPINGHIQYRNAASRPLINVAVGIGKVEVEALAIQNILSIVHQPEVREVLNATQSSIDDISRSVKGLDAGRKERRDDSLKSITPLVVEFDIRFSLLGVRISAITTHSKGHTSASIELGFGPFHLTAKNSSTISTHNPYVPTVKASIQKVGAELSSKTRGANVSCGRLNFDIDVRFYTVIGQNGELTRKAQIESNNFEAHVFPTTATTMVDIINRLQDRIRELDLTKEVEHLKHLRDNRRQKVLRKLKGGVASREQSTDYSTFDLFATTTALVRLTNLQILWHVSEQFAAIPGVESQNVTLFLTKLEFTTKGANEARLLLANLLIQLTPPESDLSRRSTVSALLPEISFSAAYWSVDKDGSLACKATGKLLDIQLSSDFLLPVNCVQRSIDFSIKQFKIGTATWQATPTASGAPRQKSFDTKKLRSILIEADFEGAEVHLQGAARPLLAQQKAPSDQKRIPERGRYGQFAPEHGLIRTSLKSPGIAFKVEYHASSAQPTVHGEMIISASSNTLLPKVVPLILDISDSIKDVIQHDNQEKGGGVPASNVAKPIEDAEEATAFTADPEAIFGKTKVDLGLRICRQEFGLSCQPIARIDAQAVLEDFYLTINTINSPDDLGRFYTVTAVASQVTAQIQHVYSREPTIKYEMESIVLSVMNSKHVNGVNGASAILELNPTRIVVNVRQLQDVLLFREIWLPPEIRNKSTTPSTKSSESKADEIIVQKYQLAMTAAAFPWNATVAITELAIDLDLGQSIGKTSVVITDLWASQQKSSDFEQILCIGLENVAVESTGRMSGFVKLSNTRIRTSIQWPDKSRSTAITPLIQASVAFQIFRAKAAFDYQVFAFGDVEAFDFLMYNVRETSLSSSKSDRLVALLDFGKAYVFITAVSAAQAVSLIQAFERLIKEKQTAYLQSLKEIERHLRRESLITVDGVNSGLAKTPQQVRKASTHAIQLRTDVVVTLGALSIGVFPSTFFDSQVLKLEANDIKARFAVGLEHRRIRSDLGLELGEVQVALSSARRFSAVTKPSDVDADEVINNVLKARGGTIVRVPRVTASMRTWQVPDENNVEYIFKSLFDGKIDVGWNLSRINFIQSMWATHSKALASRLGKPLPESAVKITAEPVKSASGIAGDQRAEKITAEVSLPQFKYNYEARQPPIIETPQLRDMGEATPPLEWIGLNRDRLPNVTHQVIIVALQEVAKEVGDAYGRILGSTKV